MAESQEARRKLDSFLRDARLRGNGAYVDVIEALLTEQDELREALAKTQAELWKLQGDPYAQAPVEAEAPERGER